VSPILVRPVREQLEHDRVIRLLQVRLKRRHDVTANIGEDQTASVKIGLLNIFPDLVLTAADRGRKLMGTVEVETSESVNHLEARAQWAHLGRARAPFHLYVPAGSVDIARRLATENQVNVSEIWSYHTIGDQTRFTLVHRAPAETRRSATPGVARPTLPARQPAKRAARSHSQREAKKDVKKRPVPRSRRAASSPARRSSPAKKSASPQQQKRK
jgi:hypothetical protein